MIDENMYYQLQAIDAARRSRGMKLLYEDVGHPSEYPEQETTPPPPLEGAPVGNLWQRMYQYVMEPDPEEVRKNLEEMQRGAEEAKNLGLGYGSLKFNYDDPESLSPRRIGMGLASGDLVREGTDIYRVSDIQTKGSRSILGEKTPGASHVKQTEILPIAFQTDAGAIKPYSYWDTDFNKTVASETRGTLAKKRGKSTSAGNQMDAAGGGFWGSLVSLPGMIGDAFTDHKNIVTSSDKMNDGRLKDYETSRAVGNMTGEVVKTIAPLGALSLASKVGLLGNVALKPWQIATGLSAMQEIPRTVSDIANDEITPIGGVLRTGINTALNIVSANSGAKSSELVGSLLANPNAKSALKQALKEAGIETAKQIGYATAQTATDTGMDYAHSKPLLDATGQSNQRNFFNELMVNGGTMAAMNVAMEVWGFGKVKGFGAVNEHVRWNVDRFRTPAEKRIVNFFESKVANVKVEADIKDALAEAMKLRVTRDKFGASALEAKFRAAMEDPLKAENKIYQMIATGKSTDEIVDHLAKSHIGVLPSEIEPTRSKVEAMKQLSDMYEAREGSGKRLELVKDADGNVTMELCDMYEPISSATITDNVAGNSLGAEVSNQLRTKYGVIQSVQEVSNIERQNIGEYLEIQTKNKSLDKFGKLIKNIPQSSTEAGLSDRNVITRVLEFYRNISGDTAGGKSITDVVDTVANYIEGTAKPYYFANNPGKYIDASIKTLHPDLVTKTMAEADRRNVLNSIIHDFHADGRYEWDDISKFIIEAFAPAKPGKKAPAGGAKSLPAEGLDKWFIKETLNRRLSYKQIKDITAKLYSDTEIKQPIVDDVPDDVAPIIEPIQQPIQQPIPIAPDNRMLPQGAVPGLLPEAQPHFNVDPNGQVAPVDINSNINPIGDRGFQVAPEGSTIPNDLGASGNINPLPQRQYQRMPDGEIRELRPGDDPTNSVIPASRQLSDATYENPVRAIAFDGPKAREVEVLKVEGDQAIVDFNPTQEYDLRRVDLSKLREADDDMIRQLVDEGHIESSDLRTPIESEAVKGEPPIEPVPDKEPAQPETASTMDRGVDVPPDTPIRTDVQEPKVQTETTDTKAQDLTQEGNPSKVSQNENKLNDGDGNKVEKKVRTKKQKIYDVPETDVESPTGKVNSKNIELDEPDTKVDAILDVADEITNIDKLNSKLEIGKMFDEESVTVNSDVIASKINTANEPEGLVTTERKAEIKNYNDAIKKLDAIDKEFETALAPVRNKLYESGVSERDLDNAVKSSAEYEKIKAKYDAKKQKYLEVKRNTVTPTKAEKDLLKIKSVDKQFKGKTVIQTGNNQKRIIAEHLLDVLHVKDNPDYMSVKGNDLTITRNDKEITIQTSGKDIVKDLRLLNEEKDLGLTPEQMSLIVNNSKTAQSKVVIPLDRTKQVTDQMIMRSGFEGMGGAALVILGSNIDDDSDFAFAKAPLITIGFGMVGGQAYKWQRNRLTKQLNGAMPSTTWQKIFIRDYNPVSSLTQENYKRSMINKQPNADLKEKVEGMYRDFENQAKTLKNSTWKAFRSLTHVKGELVRRIQNAGLNGKREQQLMFESIAEAQRKSYNAIPKIEGMSKQDVRAILIESNDKLYTEATYILRDPDITKADRVTQLEAMNDPNHIKQVLLETGIPEKHIEESFKAYEALREIPNTLTKHEMRAQTMNKYGIDIDKLDKELPKMQAEVQQLLDAVNKAKAEIKEYKNEYKKKPEYKKLYSLKDKKASEIVRDRKSATSELKSDAKLLALQGKLTLAKQDMTLKANKFKAMEYAQDFVKNSKQIHHIAARQALAKRDAMYEADFHEVNGAGQRIHDNYSRFQAEMQHFETEGERTAYVNKWIQDHKGKPLDNNELPNIWEIEVETEKGIEKTLVKINDKLHLHQANQYNASINQVRGIILRVARDNADYNVNRLKLLGELKKIKEMTIGGDIEADAPESLELVNDLVATLEASTDTNVSSHIIKDILNYAIQPKATSHFRNKNVAGYYKEGMDWNKLFDYGIETTANKTSNTYLNTFIRDALEEQILSAKSLGIRNTYTDYLDNLYDDITYASESVDYTKRVIDPAWKRYLGVAETIATTGVMGFNANSPVKNVTGGFTSSIGRLVEEGYMPQHIFAGIRGEKDAIRNKPTTAYGEGSILNDIHNEVLRQGITKQTSVAAMEQKSSFTGKMRKVQDKAFFFMKKTEEVNKYMSAMAYASAYIKDNDYRGTDLKQYVEDAAQKAAMFAGETQGLYDFVFRTDIEKLALRKLPFGKSFLTLISPSINFYAMHANMLKRALYSETKSEKFKALAGFLSTSAVAWALGGAAFVTGIGDATLVYDEVKGDDEQILYSAEKALRKQMINQGMDNKTIDLLANAWHKGLLSAVTNADFSMRSSAIEMVAPFMFQVAYDLASKDGKKISSEGWEGIVSVLSKRFIAPGRLYRAAEGLAEGQYIDRKKNPLGREFGVTDFVKTGLFGDNLDDKMAREREMFSDYDLATSQGKRRFIESAFTKNVEFNKMNPKASATLKEKVATSKVLQDNAEKINSEIEAYKRTPLMREVIKTTDKRIQEFMAKQGKKMLQDLSIKGGQYEGTNKDAAAYLEKMNTASKRYIEVQAKIPVIKKYFGSVGYNGKLENKYDKVSLKGLMPGGKELSRYPISERAYWYAMYQFLTITEDE